MNWPLLCVLLLSVGCVDVEPDVADAPNRWSDELLRPVLEAQDHRDTEQLCQLLADSSAIVREAAALALASVQDSAAMPCLLKALNDRSVVVRSTALFALGFLADSVTIQRMAEQALSEKDTTVQRAYFRASFVAMQRNGMLKDPQAIIHFLESSTGHDAVRAADALRRLPDSVLKDLGSEVMSLLYDQPSNVRQVLALALSNLGRPFEDELDRYFYDERASASMRINVLRALSYTAERAPEFFLEALADSSLAPVAIGVLEQLSELDPVRCLAATERVSDPMIRIATLGLVIRHGGDGASATAAAAQLTAMEKASPSPYVSAALIKARSGSTGRSRTSEMRGIMADHTKPAVQRQAAFKAEVKAARDVMMRSRYATREAQFAQLGSVVQEALATGDPGLICAVAELLAEEEADAIRVMLPKDLDSKVMISLQPLRDLEARILLGQVIAKRDGLPEPPREMLAFNHPIDIAKLRELNQRQRYYVVTTKGVIIIATNVNECPGSSLAFDSLVTAGYYNGKAFHRMVPNFVVQGGCPRGDGYGGMPWTLRTEIGRTPFTAGSVGLASAGPDTESCQFFITHSATPHLDGRYTRFGEVVSGMDVVWKLQVGDMMERVERIP